MEDVRGSHEWCRFTVGLLLFFLPPSHASFGKVKMTLWWYDLCASLERHFKLHTERCKQCRCSNLFSQDTIQSTRAWLPAANCMVCVVYVAWQTWFSLCILINVSHGFTEAYFQVYISMYYIHIYACLSHESTCSQF